MSLKHGILGLLTYGSMTGYELMKIFNESLTFFWNAQTSQIYRELDILEKKGWVNSEHILQEDKPNKKVLTISDEGKAELVHWLNGHAAKDMMKIRDGMTMRVFFGSEGDNDALKRELMEYRCINEHFLNSLKHTENELDHREQFVGKSGEKIYWLMGIKRGYKTAKSNIEWVDECLELLENMKGE
ncbi:PadR family transcriptional regulator [Lutibacter sp. B2]|nr:PadR family transcriptional regulator [Lutibacter sp. B2]